MTDAVVVTGDSGWPVTVMPCRLRLMHIPKTGGSALAAALGPHVHRMGHNVTLGRIPLWPPIVTIVRDPVARWVSGFDMVSRQKHMPQWERWPDASAVATDPEALEWARERWRPVFEPLTYWMPDAAYALQRLWYVAHTETLDEDFRVITEAIGATECRMPTPDDERRNALDVHGGAKSTLTDEAEAALRAYYAEDYELLAGLEVDGPPVAPR